jgi:hypothetical protein
MPRILGIDRVEFGPDKLGGLIPVGTVLGFFNHLSGSHAVPASGLVLDGFMRCDGAAIPGGQKLSGATPNLSDQRFLQGNTSSSGTLQGANFLTPTGTVSQPIFSGDAALRTDWFTTSTYSPSGSIGGSQNIDHTHSMQGHGHSFSTSIDPTSYYGYGPQASTQGAPPGVDFSISIRHSHAGNTGGPSTASTGSMSASTSVAGSSFSFSGTGINPRSQFGNSGSYTPTGTVSQPTFSGNAVDTRPKYLDCVYLIRVN